MKIYEEEVEKEEEEEEEIVVVVLSFIEVPQSCSPKKKKIHNNF